MRKRNIERREVLTRIGLLSLGGLLGASRLPGAHHKSKAPTRHPHLFINADEVAGMRSIPEVRQSIQTGIPQKVWEMIQSECEAEIGSRPLTARSIVEGRNPTAAKQNNPDYVICKAAGQRILRNALAMLLTEKQAYRKTALDQMRALFDITVWPDWIDQAHVKFGHPAGLRTGMLSQDVAIGFDWLHPYLTPNERERIVEGLNRRGIQPFLTSMKQDPWWAHEMSNWYTVIIGGLGIAGMALGDSHPQSQALIDLSFGKMRDYLSIYGSGGEFNESVAYSNATRIPVTYFLAYYYHQAGGKNFLAEHPFPQTGAWTVYSTLPPGRFAAFGDGWIGATPEVEFMTAIAAASGNPILQGFCMRHLKVNSNPYLLLWFNPTLDTASPEGQWPRGRAFQDNSAQLYSRTDWNPDKTTMVVYGKAKRDHNHAHNDVGQVCIDAMGQRMIVDLGSPSAYPEDFFDDNRWQYYNASVMGHNVPMFGNREQRSTPLMPAVGEKIDFEKVSGRILQSQFDDENGGYWQLDLSRAYAGVRRLNRTVVHLFPGFVAVLDEGELEVEETISLRWHTITDADLQSSGAFAVKSEGVSLSGQIEVVQGNLIDHQLRRHRYEAPFDRDRMGDLLEQRREPYIETHLRDKRFRVLTLFALISESDVPRKWVRDGDRWRIQTNDGVCGVDLEEEILRISSPSPQREWRIRV